jgi:hypothetical protein
MLVLILLVTGCVQYEPKSAATAENLPQGQGRISPINHLTFLSLEELFEARLDVLQGKYRTEFPHRNSLQIVKASNFAELDKIYLLTNLPEEFQLSVIWVGDNEVGVFYMALGDEDTMEARSDARFNFQYFLLSVIRWTYEDLESWGHNTPLDGIMRQYRFTEEDLIDGKYFFREGTVSKSIHWTEGNIRFYLDIVYFSTARKYFSDFSVYDIIGLTETAAIDLRDEENLAAWSAGDFSSAEKFLPDPSFAPAPIPPLLLFTVGRTDYRHNIAIRHAKVAPFIDNGRAMVPLRIIAEALDAVVDWDDSAKTAIITAQGKTLNLPVNIPLPDDMGTPVIVNGTTFVPVRYVSEALGALVYWNEENNEVHIKQHFTPCANSQT